ncbi:MAG: hypothetical protein QF464_11305, partial [Myxococcota bacterium]|nr:hypothetical protein [Myxococcota bacterium]
TGCQYTTEDAACDDANACTDDVCVAGQGCVHTPVSDFSPCDDEVVGTSPDICMAGLCRGGQTSALTVATVFWCEVLSARLPRVASYDGMVYALMTYELEGFLCGTSPCPDGSGRCHSRVLALDGVSSEPVTLVEGVLSGLGHDAVVGSTGQVGQLTSGGSFVTWSTSALALAIGASGQAGGTWSDVWGARSLDDDGTTYTLVGRTSGAGAGRIIQCQLGEDAAACTNAPVDLGDWQWSSLNPVAAEGIVTADGPLAAVVAQGTAADASSGLWITEDGAEFDLLPLGEPLTVRGTIRLSTDSAWIVGDESLFAELGPDGWTTWPSPALANPLALGAVTTLGSTLIAVGHDATDSQGAWLVALDLDEDPTDKNSWTLVPLGDHRRAYDVHASESGITVVGSAFEDGVEVTPFIWHLPL